jgi:hypothetical protein
MVRLLRSITWHPADVGGLDQKPKVRIQLWSTAGNVDDRRMKTMDPSAHPPGVDSFIISVRQGAASTFGNGDRPDYICGRC